MARAFNDIQQSILDARAAAPELSALQVLTSQEQQITGANSTSKVANWRLWVYVFAMALFILERLFDVHRKEVEDRIAQTRPHTASWYRNMALNFLYGVELVPETDYYNTSDMTEEQLQAARIIANAAPVKEVLYGNGRLRMKVVKLVNNEYAPLTSEELTAFAAYMNTVADAGTLVEPTSAPGDMLKLKMTVYYDPMVLNPLGQRLDGTDNTPVQNGIKAFLKSLKFNGSYINTRLENELENIDGVIYPVVKKAWSKFGGYSYDTADIVNVGEIDEIRIADAGHMKLDEEALEITWIAQSE